MTNGDDRIRTAQWILERQLGWIATADVKVGVIAAIQTAALGGLAAAFSAAATQKTEWGLITSLAAGVCSISAMICVALALMPRTNGPEKSLLFFGCISRLTAPAFADQLRAATDAELLSDCADQIHRNAEIARDKHRWAQNALIWSFLGVVPWVLAILLLVQQQAAK